jgi:transcriptional regulator with XRE-family HTH domain
VSTLSNEAIGQRIGVSHASVSRYKSGTRLPEVETMAAIATEFDWPVKDQVAARMAGEYASEFAKRVADSTPVGALGEAPASNQ